MSFSDLASRRAFASAERAWLEPPDYEECECESAENGGECTCEQDRADADEAAAERAMEERADAMRFDGPPEMEEW